MAGNGNSEIFFEKEHTVSTTPMRAAPPSSSVWSISPTGKDSLSPFPVGAATQSPSLPEAFPQWTPGQPPQEAGVEGLVSQASADASLHPITHDHLLLCTQVSPISGTFGDQSPSSSVAQGAGMQASSSPCTTDHAAGLPNDIGPEVSPDRGEQSTPYVPLSLIHI